MPGYVKCLFENCVCGNPIEYDPLDTLASHYLRTKTRKEVMDKAKELGVSDNVLFESTWILAYKLAKISKVNVV